jgi:hypothetical protein
MLVTRSATSAALLVALSAVLMAQAPALDVKFGLWENTIAMTMEGLPPGIDTSKMTPAQIAQMTAGMSAAMSKPVVQKTCMTKEAMASDAFMLSEQPGMKCTREIKTNTRTSYVADVTCTGLQQMKGSVNIESSGGGTAFKGSAKMASTANGKTTNVSMAMTGKYLGAACGDVK